MKMKYFDSESGEIKEFDSNDENISVEDGFYFDSVTGLELCAVEPVERFSIHDDSTFEWVMGKRFEAVSRVDMLERQKIAFCKNIDKAIAEKKRRVDQIDFRFKVELEAYAKKELTGKKQKTLRCLGYGSLSFKKINENFKIKNEKEAMDWMAFNHPDSIRIERIPLKSELDIDTVRAAPDGLFEITPEHEKFTINTLI